MGHGDFFVLILAVAGCSTTSQIVLESSFQALQIIEVDGTWVNQHFIQAVYLVYSRERNLLRKGVD